jgi:phosphate transport system permease protein
MFLVLILFMLARLIGGKGAGVLSARQRQRAMHRSQLDLYRISTLGQNVKKNKKSKLFSPKSE